MTPVKLSIRLKPSNRLPVTGLAAMQDRSPPFAKIKFLSSPSTRHRCIVSMPSWWLHLPRYGNFFCCVTVWPMHGCAKRAIISATPIPRAGSCGACHGIYRYVGLNTYANNEMLSRHKGEDAVDGASGIRSTHRSGFGLDARRNFNARYDTAVCARKIGIVSRTPI